MESVCEDNIALQQCRSGSKKAFEDIVQKYMKRAYFIALGLVGNREDAMDLSQEAFFRAYCNLDRFRGTDNFFPWFYQILRNLCFNHLRKNKKSRNNQSLADTDFVSDGPAAGEGFEPEAIAQQNENKILLWKALGALDEKQREIIILRHFQNLSYEQIAQNLFCNKGTVMSRLYYARKKLKEVLDGQKGGH